MHETRLTRGQVIAGAAALVSSRSLLRVADALAAGSVQRFVSRPDLQPPEVAIAKTSAAPGFLFVAPSSGPGQRGAMIFDDRGELVWFRPVRHEAVTDFKVQHWHGRPVLTWWEGKTVHGLGRGEWVVLDASYRELARFAAARGRAGDLHDFQLTDHGTALVTCTELMPAGRHHVAGGVVQELALPSGKLLWEWRSLDHVPVAETEIKAKPGPQFDYFHVNSIDVDVDGNLIVSARNTWAAYKLERGTGRVLWRLGGKRSDFSFGAGARFEWQHDVRSHGDGLVSVFDNAAAPQEEPQSRALLLHLDMKRKHASLVRAFTHRPDRVLSHFMGNAQLLANGDVFVGWGGSRWVTEFARDGTIVFDARLPKGGQSYRAFRFPWVGRPAQPPTIVRRDGRVYASWNGATEVASWQVDGETFARTGFETVLKAGARVVPLDRNGSPL